MPAPDVRFLLNPNLDRTAPYGLGEQWILSHDYHRDVFAEISSWPDYAVTPLHDLADVAVPAGVGRLLYKDESQRFEVGSFKALGGAYGVLRWIQDEVERVTGARGVTALDVLGGAHREIAAGITVTCATDGNHGRAVAWGARMFGCRAVVYLPAAASREREEAIAAYGAEIVRTNGSYDEAVRQAQVDAQHNARFVVSDTSYEAYVNIPRDIMQGYTVMVREILDQLPDGDRLTHVFLQGGVGGFAAAVVGHLWEGLGAARPKTIVVEPERADCLFQSAAAGKPTSITDVHGTALDALACGEVSRLAWFLLEHAADAFMTIPDDAALRAVELLRAHDPPISAGPSGAAGLAGMSCAAENESIRTALGLDGSSRVLVIGTERNPADDARFPRPPIEA